MRWIIAAVVAAALPFAVTPFFVVASSPVQAAWQKRISGMVEGRDSDVILASDLAREYALARRAIGNPDVDARITRAAIAAAFCDEATKARLLGWL